MDKYKNPIGLAGGEEPFVCPQSLVVNTYQGCGFDCSYCYAKSLMERFGNWEIKPADFSIIERKFYNALVKKTRGVISKLIRRKIPVRIGTLTDPFQPIERNHEVTLKTLKLLSKYNYPVIVNTKGILQAEDRYIDIMKDMDLVLQETITTLNEDITDKLEPYAPKPSKRIKALKKISEAGIPTQVRYSPVFPLLTDEPKELFLKIKEAGVNDVISEYVRISVEKHIDKALGYCYIDMLKEEEYPIEKRGNFWKVKQSKLFKEYRRHKQIAEENNLNYYICSEEKPEINDWRNCCGVDKYKGFKGMGMDWTIQMNGEKFTKEGISFWEYIGSSNCPYIDMFRDYWDEGKLEGCLTGLKKKGCKYVRKD